MWNKRRNRMAPTPQNFGNLARRYNNRLPGMEMKPTEWDDFVRSTVAHARTQIIAYEYVDADTRAQWALENNTQHQDYVGWQRICAEFGSRP